MEEGDKVARLPKLKVKWFLESFSEETIDLEQAKYRLPLGPPYALSVMLDGQRINSYEELVQLATQDRYKDNEFLEVVVLTPIGGG